MQHLNPKSGKVEEKHLKESPMTRSTKLTALYTLIVHTDGNFEILVNREKVRSGTLSTEFNPPFSTPAEIDDPSDVKPDNWVEEEM